MKHLSLFSATLLMLTWGCSNTPAPDSASSAGAEDSVFFPDMISEMHGSNEIYSKAELDSINSLLKTSGIDKFPGTWVQVIQNGSDWAVMEPMNGDNPKIHITIEDGAYILTQAELQTASQNVITAFREEKNRYVITYLAGIQWAGSLQLDYMPTDHMYTYYDFVLEKFSDKKYPLLRCDFPGQNSIFTDSTTASKLEVIKPEQEMPVIDYDNIELQPAQ